MFPYYALGAGSADVNRAHLFFKYLTMKGGSENRKYIIK
jgi:hypothetical protein